VFSKKPPVSVTVLSWFLIGSSVFVILYLPFSFNNPQVLKIWAILEISPERVTFLSILSLMVNAGSGAGMLNRKRWGKLLYLFGTPALLAVTAVIYNFKMIETIEWGAGLYLLVLVVLTRTPVTEYFSDTTEKKPAEMGVQTADGSSVSGKKIGAVVLLIFGGVLLNAWFLMLGPLAHSFEAVLLFSVIFGIIGAVFIIPAISLWGRKKWAVVLGWLLTTLGAVLLMTGGMLLQFTSIQDSIAPENPEIFRQMMLSSMLSGMASGTIGALLIYLQRVLNKSDKK
jgi:hypothetical protein